MAAARAKKIASGSRRKTAKKAKRGVAKAAKAGKARKASKTSRQKTSSGPPASTPTSSGGNPKGLRVRMYRVGFGDFFLLSVPTPKGPKPFRHILIDCGVH